MGPTTKQLRCPRCGRTYPPETPTYGGCGTCAADGVGVNLVCDTAWDADEARAAIQSRDVASGLWRYGPLLPVPDRFAVTIGEGDTPLLHLDNLGREWGMTRLHVKVEGQNPTWSHKDRLCAVGVAAARWSGSSVVTGSSTGNHGASVAAYAARAGLGCVIFTLSSVPATMKTLMQAYGAEVVACRTLEERYMIMLTCAERFGWFPLTNSMNPPIGSSPFGVDGYKTIAYELWAQLGRAVPDWIVVPVAYGDCLAGIQRGWEDLRQLGLVDRVPRLVGAEVFGPLARALASPDAPLGPMPTRPTHAFSIGGGHTTYQAVAAVRASNGTAAGAPEDEMMQVQLDLAGREGVYAEAASVLGLAVTRRLLRDGTIAPDDLVVSLLTSSGLKDPAATAERLAEVAVIDPTVDALQAALRREWRQLGRDVPSREGTYFAPIASPGLALRESP